MATRVVREVRKRGVFGWIFLILFYGVALAACGFQSLGVPALLSL